MIEYLPARLVAAEGESLSSWLDRVSDANDIPRRLFWPRTSPPPTTANTRPP